MFSLTCVWITGWVNNHGAGDLKRHRGHYDVTVMSSRNIAWVRNCQQELYLKMWWVMCRWNDRLGVSAHHFTIMGNHVYTHDDVIKWKHFLRYWPFVQGIHRWPVNSPHKGQWRGALIFCLWSAPEPTVEKTMETPVIWGTIALIMTSRQCCNLLLRCDCCFGSF